MKAEVEFKKLAISVRELLADLPPRAAESAEKVNQNKQIAQLQIAAALLLPLKKASKESGLSTTDPNQLLMLACLLARSIFGRRGPGRREGWTKKVNNRLLKDYERVRKQRPDLKTEKAVCKELHRLKQYQNLKPSSLRRRLQDAKRVRQREADERRDLNEVVDWAFNNGPEPGSVILAQTLAPHMDGRGHVLNLGHDHGDNRSSLTPGARPSGESRN